MSIFMDKTFFSDWLTQQMRERDISQAELARRSGLTRQAISNYINQKVSKPDEAALAQIAAALKLPAETVYRAAGLLPPDVQLDFDLEEWKHILRQLTEDNREELLEVARVKLERQGLQSLAEDFWEEYKKLSEKEKKEFRKRLRKSSQDLGVDGEGER